MLPCHISLTVFIFSYWNFKTMTTCQTCCFMLVCILWTIYKYLCSFRADNGEILTSCVLQIPLRRIREINCLFAFDMFSLSSLRCLFLQRVLSTKTTMSADVYKLTAQREVIVHKSCYQTNLTSLDERPKTPILTQPYRSITITRILRAKAWILILTHRGMTSTTVE